MKKNNVTMIATSALITALICIFAPMSVPIGPIPVSLTNLILYFAIFIVGTKGSLVAYGVYLLLGIVGLPVFSGYAGGIAKIAGPTGGYLIGFIPMILIMGIAFERFAKKSKPAVSVTVTMVGMILGTAVAYAFGTVWFVFQMKCEWMYALEVCVFPFIIFDLAKMVIANIIGRMVRKALLRLNLIA